MTFIIATWFLFKVDLKYPYQLEAKHFEQTDDCLDLGLSGAKNVVNACREGKVRRLIYNSSADVVFDGTHDIINGDESLPYPWTVSHSKCH